MILKKDFIIIIKTSQELQMLSRVTLNCRVTNIFTKSGSQLSETQNCNNKKHHQCNSKHTQAGLPEQKGRPLCASNVKGSRYRVESQGCVHNRHMPCPSPQKLKKKSSGAQWGKLTVDFKMKSLRPFWLCSQILSLRRKQKEKFTRPFVHCAACWQKDPLKLYDAMFSFAKIP